ncbi:hypothetical protein G3I40_11415 [Streptomyces sp. SID14478]|uniref:hypothetical protein n=1 Tax=Streptomyces sp. SID14478 TaxID=2706073 RepID=UPI0013DC65BE|nr:hypothetical protein [Streptomyces sp. SID14478]NEB75831.1 hypothetical protein [Streptomyces sp. SID14478]
MLTCPHPPPITLVMDPHDDVTHTRAALAAHDPAHGRITVHPTPGTNSTLALAYDILAALGKPVPLTGYRTLDTQPAWTLCAAWILALPITSLTVLRTHLLSPRALTELLTLRTRTGLHLAMVCHKHHSTALERTLRHTDHFLADAEATLSLRKDNDTEEPPATPAHPSQHWINLPSLTPLNCAYTSNHCACRAPAPHVSRHDQRRITQRLHAATAHPHLAAKLATACFAAATMPQLSGVRIADIAIDGTTLTLHDRTQPYDPYVTHRVPHWAQVFLRAAAYTHYLTTARRSDFLFTDPLGCTSLPPLTDFAEDCRLRPPQPPPAKRRKNARPTPPPPTVWPRCTPTPPADARRWFFSGSASGLQ